MKHETLQPGDLIDGKYRVVRVLGRGGMGMVVEATHLRLGTSVAIKVLASGRSNRLKNVDALVREAQVSARLKSEHVARVFDVGMLEDGTPFVVMEHLTGCTLHEAIYGGVSPMPVERAVTLILEACDAVAEAHGLGIIHRDLKPANLFLTRLPNGRDVVKVLDFGIAKLATDARVAAPPPSDKRLDAFCTGEFAPGAIVAGTPQYMAPELFDRIPVISPAGDVWALGVILYELLLRKRPWESKQLLELIWRVTSAPPAPPRELRPDLPPALEAVVLRCLTRDRSVRYARVDDLVADLQPFAAPPSMHSRPLSYAPSSPIPSITPTVEPATVAVAPRRPRSAFGAKEVAICAGLAALVLGLGAAKKATAHREAEPAPVLTPVRMGPVTVAMSGSSTVAELGEHWSSAIGGSRTDVVLKVQSTSTAAGLGALARREVDLVGASRPATEDEIALARQNGVELEPHVVARDGLAVVVHPENRVDALTFEQLRGILTGRIRSWSALPGGAKGPIHVLARPEDQGSSEILRHAVLREKDALADNVEVVRRTDDVVARVRTDPYAVSFVTFRDVGATKALKLKVGTGAPVAPSVGTIRSEHYPLRRDLYVYTRRDAARAASDVLAFIEGPGRRVASEAGFVPPP